MINGPIFRIPLRMALAIFVGVLSTGFGVQDSLNAADQLTAGSSSKQLRNQTVASIPFERLNPQAKNKISDVVNKPNVYRRLPVTAIDVDPDYFRFLVRYPEVIVNIWQMMGVTQMTTERTGPFSISTDDGAGTLSDLELVYGTENQHIFFGSGTYEGPILKRKLAGKCVLVLTSKSGTGVNGKPTVTSQLDVFLKIENATAGLIAKTITPIVGSTADHNFVESLKFVQRLNETTEKNGPGVQNMSKRLDISEEVRKQFHSTVDLVFQRAINATPVEQRSGSGRTEPRISQNTRGRELNTQTRTSVQAYQPAVNRNAPVYESFKDSGANSKYRRQNGYSTDSSYYQQPAVLPARGSRAPAYPIQQYRAAGTYLPQPSGFGAAVRASYNGYAPQVPSIQPASAWRQR